MSNGFFHVPPAKNEPVLAYAPGSAERSALQDKLKELKAQTWDVPMFIGGKEVRTNNTGTMRPPHELKHTLGTYHKGDASHVQQAIDAALYAKCEWENTSWEHRAAIFLKAADLLAGPYRTTLNAATMLCQSKNAYQAEIDSACELIDFFRYNVQFASEIYNEQPQSSAGIWNRSEYRALEGFVLAVTPFNFTAIAGNLPCSMALMGNTVVWKPAETQIFSAHFIMRILKEAGLPDGVINLVYVSGATVGEVCFNHREFAGVHFTGSTGVFNGMWKTIGANMDKYRSYPRIVGETGGKDFIFAHPTAKVRELAVAMVRGAFEYQGQKCSAASRAYVPASLWEAVKKDMLEMMATIKVGPVDEFSNFVNAVIDEKSFDKLAAYIDAAKKDPNVEIIAGGTYDKSEGYFIQPTVLLAKDPQYVTMCEELFGPVLSVHVYDDANLKGMLDMLDNTSPYALTGSIFAQDRYVIGMLTDRLRHCAGNFYINDKPTGAVVGQQPFGGARASGTNDKAGSKLNLLRWVSARTLKETFVPPTDYTYPFMK
jgi:1-pyrroline-5-carboxylate dehydrogenase